MGVGTRAERIQGDADRMQSSHTQSQHFHLYCFQNLTTFHWHFKVTLNSIWWLRTGFVSFQYLCECQFDENVKFKTAINEEDPDKMRILPIGRDKDGQMYWFQLDQDDNVRVYVEEQDDLDGSSWKCIVKSVDKMRKMEHSNAASALFV